MSDWNQIVSRNAAQVVNAAFRILGNSADAEDVAQDVFTEAVRKWNASTEHNWAGLLRRMAICRAIDALRARRPTEPLCSSHIDMLATTPDRSAIDRDLQQAVRRSVAELPGREAEVFCLVYFERMSHDEVAQNLDMKKSAVAAALSSARKTGKAAAANYSGRIPMTEHYDRQLEETLSIDIADAVRAIASSEVPLSSVERIEAFGLQAAAKQAPESVMIPSGVEFGGSNARRAWPVATACLVIIVLLSTLLGGMFLFNPMRQLVAANRLAELRHHHIRRTMADDKIRVECFGIATAKFGTSMGLEAAFYVANNWPDSAEADSSRQIALRSVGTLPLDELADCLDRSRPRSGQSEHWREFAIFLRDLVREEPQHPRAARLLVSVAIIYKPADDEVVASSEFTEVADLIREEYATSPDLPNFCEIIGNHGQAVKWAQAYEPHLRRILEVNQDRFVRISAHYALASVVRSGGTERRAEARQLYKEFLIQFDGKTKYPAKGIELDYRQDSERILQTL